MSTFIGLGYLLGFMAFGGDSLQPTAKNAFQIVTGDDSEEDGRRWDAIYKTPNYVFGKDPAPILKEVLKLPVRGKALDIAMGEGRNAVFLAKNGFRVVGVDISEVALHKARLLAKENGVSIQTVQADLNTYAIDRESYDLVVNINYLQRSLIPSIKTGLKRGGYVVFENFTEDQLRNEKGKHLRRDELLRIGELRSAFADLEIVVYRETNDGNEAVAQLIARKP